MFSQVHVFPVEKAQNMDWQGMLLMDRSCLNEGIYK